MLNRINAVYGRQSVDRKDSISIESQIEFCEYELKGESYKAYTDKGYSGKNTDRPKFQQLMADIQKGLIKKVVVYKLDRISRSILDFAGLPGTLVTVYDPGIYLLILPVISRYEYRIEGSMLGADNGPTI